MTDTRELLLIWVRAKDGDTWLQDTIDCESADETHIGECRAEAHRRAAEYHGQVAEQRVRIPGVSDLFSEPPVVDGEVAS